MTTATENYEPSALERGDVLPEDEQITETPEADAVVAELESKIENDRAEESKKDSRIPAARHKEILEKEREKRAELERKVAELEQGRRNENTTVDISAAEAAIEKMDEEYDVLITDGELAKAAALKQRIRRTERDINEAKSDMKIHAAEVRATERARYSSTLDRAEAQYPEINPDHDSYNPRMMTAVSRLKSASEAQGMSPSAALQEALDVIFHARDQDDEPAEKKNVSAERKAAAVQKTAGAVGKTPPSLSRSGVDSDRLGGGAHDARAVMNMSQKDFAKLTDDQLSKMRGDTL